MKNYFAPNFERGMNARNYVNAHELHRYEKERMSRFVGLGNWHYFGTITAKHELTAASARRVAVHFRTKLENAVGVKMSDGGGHMFWVAEPHKHTASGFHVHFLLEMPDRYHAISRRARWEFILQSARNAVGGQPWLNQKGVLGRWHRVEVQDYKGITAAEYCAKYVTKDLVDWDFFLIF